MKDIKTIIFDLGGVLMDLDKQKCIDAFKKLGFSDIDKYLGNYEQKGMFMDLENGTISAPKFRDEIRRHIGQAVSDQQIDEAFNSFLFGIPGQKLSLLERLHQKYTIFMLSNTNPIMVEGRISELFRAQGQDIFYYFDRLYLSYQLRATKPSPIIFEKLIADSGILPQESLLLDDSPKNIETARKFGFHTHLVVPPEDFSFIFD